MRRLIFFLIIVALAIACGLLIANHPGLLQIEIGTYHISMSLWIGIVASLIGYAVMHIAYRLIKGSLRAPRRLRYHFKEKRLQRSRRKQSLALRFALRGQWKHAARRWEQAAKTNEHPALYHLLSAACATHINDQDVCEKQLLLAEKNGADEELVDLIKAYALIESGDTLEASQHLLIHAELPQAAFVLATLALNHHKGGEALVYLKQAKPAMSENKHEELLTQALLYRLSELSNELNAKDIESLRRDHKRLFSSNQALETACLNALIRCGSKDSAQKRMLKILKKEWREDLLSLLAETSKDNPDSLLRVSEEWLNKHPNSPGLHAYLGELYLHTRRSQKAITHLKQAHAASPSAKIAHQLGQAYSQVGSLEEALRWYAAGCDIEHDA